MPRTRSLAIRLWSHKSLLVIQSLSTLPETTRVEALEIVRHLPVAIEPVDEPKHCTFQLAVVNGSLCLFVHCSLVGVSARPVLVSDAASREAI